MLIDEIYYEKLLAYAKDYQNYDAYAELKTIHMLAVTRVIDKLSDSLGLDDHMKQLAHITGLFHDLGRYEQIKCYGTFRDEKSIDHANLSEKVMLEGGFVKELSPKDQKMIGIAIRNHNKYSIEEGVEGDTLILSKLIRDADKSDIFRIIKNDGFFASYGYTKTEMENSLISPEIYESIMNHELVSIKYRKYPLDFVLTCMAMIFDFNFKESLKIVKQAGLYRCELDNLDIKNTASYNQLKILINEADTYINEKTKKI